MFYRFNENEFGKYLRKIRQKYLLTQSNLAQEAGIGVESVRRLEKGEIKPSTQMLHLLSIALKVDLIKSFREICSKNSLTEFYEKLDRIILEDDTEKMKEISLLFDSYNSLVNNTCVLEYSETDKLKLMLQGLEKSYRNSDGSNSAIDSYVNAIRLDIRNFKLKSFSNMMLSHLDARCIHLIAIEKNLLCEYKESNEISLELMKHYDEVSKYSLIDNITWLKIKLYVNISYNYHGLNDAENAMKYAQHGINYCIEKKVLYLLHALYCRKAVAMNYLNYSIEEVTETFRTGINLMDIANLDDLKDIYLRVIKDKYNISLFS